MTKKLSTEQKKELRVLFKNVVKNDLKRNASSTRILDSFISETDEGVVVSVSAYFFTVGPAEWGDHNSMGGISTHRWNIKFTTKPYETEAVAFDRLKELVSDAKNYNFSKVKTEETALYRTVYESIFVEN